MINLALQIYSLSSSSSSSSKEKYQIICKNMTQDYCNNDICFGRGGTMSLLNDGTGNCWCDCNPPTS